MFDLARKNCKLQHLNTRIEKHGDEDVLACDLRFEYTCSNLELDRFSPDLMYALFKRDDDKLDLFQDGQTGAHLTVVRHPQIGVIKWDGAEIIGGTLTFDYGAPEKAIQFDGVTIGGYKIEPLQGGSIKILFRAQVNPAHDQRAILMDLLELGTVTVTIEPPAPPAALVDQSKEPADRVIDGTVNSDVLDRLAAEDERLAAADADAPKARGRGRGMSLV